MDRSSKQAGRYKVSSRHDASGRDVGISLKLESQRAEAKPSPKADGRRSRACGNTAIDDCSGYSRIPTRVDVPRLRQIHQLEIPLLTEIGVVRHGMQVTNVVWLRPFDFRLETKPRCGCFSIGL